MDRNAFAHEMRLRYQDEIIRVMRMQRRLKANQDNPFLLYFPHTFPHQPLHASPEFRGRSEGGFRSEEPGQPIGFPPSQRKQQPLSYGT